MTVWPDNDHQGMKYVAGVCRSLIEAEAASVRVVIIPSPWPESWDLANRMPPGTNKETLQTMIDHAVAYAVWEGFLGSQSSNLLTVPKENANGADSRRGFQPSSSGSADSWVPAGFRIGPDGSILHEANNDDWQPLCSPLVVEAATRNTDGEEWGRLLRIRDRDGIWHAWALPMAELAGDGDAYRARLLSLGLELESGPPARKALHRLLTSANPQARIRCVPTLGWHGGAFVLPDEVIGQSAGDRPALQTSAPLQHNFKVAGTLQEWQDSIAKLAISNSRLAFALRCRSPRRCIVR